MTHPPTDFASFALTLEDLEHLFVDFLGDEVDRLIVAASWYMMANFDQRAMDGIAEQMVKAVYSAPEFLMREMEKSIQETKDAFREEDSDLAEVVTFDAWDLLILRDRVEDLRLAHPELFDESAINALASFDASLDQADVWLDEIEYSRVHMGEQLGKVDRRWWRPIPVTSKNGEKQE